MNLILVYLKLKEEKRIYMISFKYSKAKNHVTSALYSKLRLDFFC